MPGVTHMYATSGTAFSFSSKDKGVIVMHVKCIKDHSIDPMILHIPHLHTLSNLLPITTL